MRSLKKLITLALIATPYAFALAGQLPNPLGGTNSLTQLLMGILNAVIKIGIPAPEQLAPFVGVVEIVCGALLLLGLFSRLAVMPLLAVIGTALVTTKVPVLLKDGFWKAAHESRTDWSMLLSLLFLLVAGAGPWSFDARRSRRDG